MVLTGARNPHISIVVRLMYSALLFTLSSGEEGGSQDENLRIRGLQ